MVTLAVARPGECGSETPSLDTSPAPEELENRRKGFPCLSTWDGNHDGLEALVRDRLNDPGSMDTHEARIAPVDPEGVRPIIMDFRCQEHLRRLGAFRGYGHCRTRHL